MKKILLITPILPYPPDDGSRLRTYQIIRFLSKKYSIDLISFYLENENYLKAEEFLKQYCQNVILLKQKSGSILKSKLFVYSANKENKKIINEIIKKNKYDIIQLEKVITVAYLDGFVFKNYRTVLDSWGIDCEVSYKQYLNGKNLVNFMKYIRNFIAEVFYTNKIRYLVAITNKHKEFYLKFLKNKEIFLIPMAVDTDYFKPEPQINVEGNTIVFVGIMNFLPNVDAVKFFCKDIIPKLKEKTDFKFYIVGKNPTQEILKLYDGKYVVVTGTVEDVREYILKARIVVAPLRIGSGFRNKVVQAMACGKAVIATAEACEGLEVKDNENILIASTPDEFVNKILLLLNNDELREKIGKNARRFVEENYSYEMIEKKWLKVYEEIFSDHNNSR